MASPCYVSVFFLIKWRGFEKAKCIMRIECKDNLEMMQELQSESIDLIYGDILYGTGRKFGDYQDLKADDQKIINDFYFPRIKEMHRILKNTGTIYLQMDYRIVHWLRCIMDGVFGYHNFLNEIIWNYNSAPRKKNCFGHRHDNILRYSKTKDFYFNEDEVREPYSLSAPRGYEKEKYYNDNGKVMGDVWQLNMLGQNDKTERVDYDTQKPKTLLRRIIKSSSKEKDVVADFFLGSGTTAVVCKELNRDFIGCDINKRAVEITTKRLSAVCISPLLNFT